MLAGYLAMASSFALHWVVGRVAPLHYVIPDLLQQFPFFTLLSILLMLSVIAGIVEEAAFRGYMQGPIERRHGLAVAIVVVSIVFGLAHLTDLQPSMTIARMFFIVVASVLYGVLVHLTDSIRPGVVLHATGDAIGIVWIWWLTRHPGSGPSQHGLSSALNDTGFWMNGLLSVVFGVAAVWAFRRLARVARSERAEASSL